MGLWQSLGGMAEVELTSAELGAALQAINRRDIPLHRVNQIGDLTARFWISRRDYRKLRNLCEKRGESLKLFHRSGIYWTIKSLLHRPVLLFGMAFLTAMVFYLPTRVLFVQVEGNQTVPTNRILEAAEESGIRFGASRREVRSERMKNALLGAVPELQWAGVNTAGCVATISVRERTVAEPDPEVQGVTSIVALRDGIITSCTVTSGTALCTVGQAVQEGQLLVSGYTDCGICIRAEQSQGEIFAQTNRTMTAVSLSDSLRIREAEEKGRSYSLLFGKKRINLWKDSGISDATCGRMYEEYYITLPGGFRLPLGLAVDVYTERECTEGQVDQATLEARLSAFAESCLTSQMVAGQILSRQEQVISQPGLYILEGEFVCTEMIGKVQREQIGE